MGTSHNSQVGSLKEFGSYRGRRLFRSDGDIAASLPAHAHAHLASAPMLAGRRVAPAISPSSSSDKFLSAAAAAYNLVSGYWGGMGWAGAGYCAEQWL